MEVQDANERSQFMGSLHLLSPFREIEVKVDLSTMLHQSVRAVPYHISDEPELGMPLANLP